MIRRLLELLVFASLLVVAVCGQNTAMQDMMKAMSSDPRMQEMMEQQLKEFAKLTPEEMMAKMKQAMETLSNSGDMVDQMIARKDEMLSDMKRSGMVPKELIQKYEQDPEFFEQEIRATFGSKENPMSKMFTDAKQAAEAMKNMVGQAAPNVDAMKHMETVLKPQLQAYKEQALENDVKEIEKQRLEMLSKIDELGKADPMFRNPELLEALSDRKKWLKAVRKGQKNLKNDKMWADSVEEAAKKYTRWDYSHCDFCVKNPI